MDPHQLPRAGRRAQVLTALLLAAVAVNLLTAIARKSITNDESVHIPAGYYHLVAGDFRVNNEHPPLVKLWAALPVALLQSAKIFAGDDRNESSTNHTWNVCARFWQANGARFESVTFWPRVMMVPLTLALGALVFVCTARFFGTRAALFAVILFALEPNILAHGRVVHTDVPAALAYLLFFFLLHRYAERPDVRRALAVGLAVGLALVTKLSMLVLVPVTGVFFFAQLLRAPHVGQPRGHVATHAAVLCAAALFIVNAAYGFRSEPITPADLQWIALRSADHLDPIMAALGALARILPTYFLFGIYNVAMHNQSGHAAALLGEHRTMGWWYYFPVAFALKTTLPFLTLSIASLAWSLWRAVLSRDGRHVFILVPLAIYMALSFTSRINIGLRHFLPVFPFLFIAGGALLDRLLRPTRLRPVGVVLIVAGFGSMAFEVGRTYPHYIPYMNQLASPHPHWWYLSDSNIEWGDDVGALAAYLRARGETRVRAALSGGWATLGLYGVEYVSLFHVAGETQPATRYTALGASVLNGSTVPGGLAGTGRDTEQNRVNFFDAYRTRIPEAVFGHSVYLYREDD